jgi:tetratricopeptide (TPR) repeat protein
MLGRVGVEDGVAGMGVDVVRILLVVVCLIWLAGCATAPFGNSAATPTAAATPSTAATPVGAYAAVTPPTGTAPGLLGSDPQDELSLGKKAFREANYGLAEEHFRKAVESHPNDGEAWLGLAAANDRLQRFDLADRAYKEAIRILGPRPEILNNQGYSYMLRGDYARARRILIKAKAGDPDNPYILNNLKLLAKVARKGKALE